MAAVNMIRPLLLASRRRGVLPLTSRGVLGAMFPALNTKVTGVGIRCYSVITEGRDVNHAKDALRKAQAVCFDVDSTVCSEEGIDVLADFCGAAQAVADLTNRAMGGSMKFEDALKARLDLMRPSKVLVAKCLKEHPPRLSPGISDLVSMLHGRGVAVYLVSGGFRQMIEPVAERLSIPKGNIFANRLIFDAKSGEYMGFDENEPTSRDGGKPKVVSILMDQFRYSCVVMVGDGATDMQAKPPADAFIGYGGVSVRDTVREEADWFVTEFSPLLKVLEDDRQSTGAIGTSR